MIEIGEPDFFPVDDGRRCSPRTAGACALRGPCPGLYRGYREVHGDGEVRPKSRGSRARTLSLRAGGWRRPTVRAGLAPSAATAWRRGTAADTSFCAGRALVRYRTESRDFTDVEIETTKHELGQVYLDVSGEGRARRLREGPRAAPPQQDVRRVPGARTSAPGSSRPCRATCSPATTPGSATRSRGSRGDVLDVGCGEGRYEEVLEGLATSGRIRYTGREPAAARAAMLQARWPWARSRSGRRELRQAGRSTTCWRCGAGTTSTIPRGLSARWCARFVPAGR